MNTEVNGPSVIIGFTMVNFGDWLLELLKQKDISQSELARLAKVSKGTISNLVNGTKKPNQDTLTAIAHALKLPSETVFRAAGLLPPKSERDELITQINYDLEQLPPEEKLGVLEFIRMRRRFIEEREKKNGPRREPANRTLSP